MNTNLLQLAHRHAQLSDARITHKPLISKCEECVATHNVALVKFMNGALLLVMFAHGIRPQRVV